MPDFNWTVRTEEEKLVDDSNPLFSTETKGPEFSWTPRTGSVENIMAIQNHYGERISEILRNTTDPDAYDKLIVSAFLADRLGAKAEDIYGNFDESTKQYFGAITPVKTAKAAIVDAYSTGVAYQKAAIATFRFLMGDTTPGLEQYVQDLIASAPALDDIKRQWWAEIGKSAASLAASTVESWKFAAPAALGGAAAATPAALASGFAPLATLGIISSGFFRGMSWGASAYTAMAEAGGLAMTLLDQYDKAGVPREVSMPIVRAAALPVGLINGAIEKLTFKYTPGVSSLIKAAEGDVTKAIRSAVIAGGLTKKANEAILSVLKFGAAQGLKEGAEDVIANLSQEVLQELTTDIGNNAAIALTKFLAQDHDIPGADKLDQKTIDEIANDLKTTFIETAKAMAAFGPAGAAGSTIMNASAAAKFMQKAVDVQSKQFGVTQDLEKLQPEKPKPATIKADPLHEPSGELRYRVEGTVASEEGAASYMFANDNAGERKGYIKFAVEDQKVVIDEVDAEDPDVKLDMIRTLSAKYAPLDVEWNPQSEDDLDIREQLAGPNEENLQKYTEPDPMAPVRDRVKTALKNAGAISDEQAETSAIMMELYAQTKGMSLDALVKQYVGEEIAVAGLPLDPVTQKGAQDLMAQGKTPVGAAGFRVDGKWVPGSEITRLKEHAETVFFLSQRGDFKDVAHELTHGFVGFGLNAQQQKAAEALVGGVAMDQWSAKEHETLARAVEEYVPYIIKKIEDGQKSKEANNVLKRITQYVVDAIWKILTIGQKRSVSDAQKFVDELFGFEAHKIVSQNKEASPGKTKPLFKEGSPAEFQGRDVTMTHWSKVSGMTRTDPAYFGTGSAGAERARYGAGYTPVTYFGVPPYQKEAFVAGENRYKATVSGDKIYDYAKDPLKLWPTEEQAKDLAPFDRNGRINLYEKNIKDAGFDGYYSRDYGVVAMYNPVDVTQAEPGAESFVDEALFKAITETPEFKKWFGDSKVVDENGDPLAVYHGTTAIFDVFSSKKANPESNLGAGFYFTNNPRDVGHNYAGLGPDLINKIDLTAERIASDTGRDYDSPEVIAEARARFMEHQGAVMPVFLRIENPVVIGGSDETLLDYQLEYNEETDEYEEETGRLVDFLVSFRDAAESYDVSADFTIDTAIEKAFDSGGISVSEIIKIAKADLSLMDAMDEEEQLVAADIIRQAFENIGFDGFIDRTVGDKFAGMEGMDEGTVHYIAFRPEQIKSAIGNRGTFDPSNPSVLFKDDFELGTRVPTSKKGGSDPTNPDTTVSLDALLSDEKLATKAADAIENYINFREMPGASAKDRLEAFVQHATENLVALYDMEDPAVRERAKLWYAGARAITERWAPKYGLNRVQIAGVIAALSPQKDWFQNISLAERVLDVATRPDLKWSERMTEAIGRLEIFKVNKKAEEQAHKIKGKSFLELSDDFERAIFVRAYHEAHSDKGFRLVTPEGDFGDKARNLDGAESSIIWSDFNTLVKALSIIRDGSPENISASIGMQHKVRSFYNNIIAPFSERGQVTIDTHAVAAALLRPLAGRDIEVLHNFGSTIPGIKANPGSSANLGLVGTYAIYSEAYRRAAEARGVLPREMQSITWEAIRALFPATFKRNKKARAKIDGIFDQYRKGDIDGTEARRLVIEAAGGMGTPEWARSSPAVHDQEWATSYEGELSRSQVLGGIRAGRGAGGDDTGAVQGVVAPLLKVVDTAKEEDRVGVTGGARPGRFSDSDFSPIVHPNYQTDLGLVREKLLSAINSDGARWLINHLFGIDAPVVFKHRGSWLGEPEPSYTIRAEGMTKDQAEKLAALLGLMTAQESVVAWDAVHADDKNEFRFPVLYLADDVPMSQEKMDAVQDLLVKAGIDYSTTTDGKGFKTLVFGDDAEVERVTEELKKIAKEAGVEEVGKAYGTSSLLESAGYSENLREVRGEDPATGPSDLFRRAVDLIFAPYFEAITEQGYGFNPANYQRTFGLTDAETAYVAGVAQAVAEKVGAKIQEASLYKVEDLIQTAAKYDSWEKFREAVGGEGQDDLYRKIWERAQLVPSAEDLDATLKRVWDRAVADDDYRLGLDPAVLRAAQAIGTGKTLSDKLKTSVQDAIRRDPSVIEESEVQNALPEDAEDYSITERIRMAQSIDDPELAAKVESGEVSEADILTKSRFLMTRINDLQDKLSLTKKKSGDIYSELSPEEKIAYGLKDRIEYAERELASRESRIQKALDIGKIDQKLVDLRAKTVARLKDLRSQYEALDERVRYAIEAPEMGAMEQLERTAEDRIKAEKRLAYGQSQAEIKLLKKQYRDAEAQRRILRQIRELRAKIERQVKKIPKSIDYSYTEPMRIISRAVQGENVSPAEWENFQDFLDENAVGYMFTDDTLRLLKSIPPKDWNISDLEDIYQRIRLMKRFGRAKRTIFLEMERNTRQAEQLRAINTVLRGKNLVIASGPPKESNLLIKAAVEAGKPHEIALMLDGGKPGVFTRWLIDEVNDSWNETQRQADRRMEPILARMNELKLTLNPFDPRIATQGFKYLGRKVEIAGYRYTNGQKPSVQDVMFWYIGSRNERTAKALLAGNNLPAEIIDASIDALSAQEKELAELIAKDFAVEFERTRQAFIKQFNMDLPGEAWYVPMRRKDVSYSERREEMVADLIGRNGLGKSFVARNHTFARVDLNDKFQTPIRTDLVNLWMSEVAKQEAFIAQDLTVKRLHAIFEDLDVKRAIQQKFGPSMNKWLSKYINDIARPDIYAMQTGTDRFVGSARAGLSISYMGLNLLSFAKQLVSVFPFLADAGPVHIVSAAGQWLAAKRSLDTTGALPALQNSLIEFVEGKSMLVKHRSISRDIEEVKRLDKNAYQQLIKQIGSISLHHLEVIDKVSIVIGWKAVYDRYVGKVGEAEAVKLADKAVVRGQPSGRVQDLAQMYRSGEAAKWFTMFTNAINSLFNIVAFDVPRAIRQKQVFHAAGDITAIILTGLGISIAAGALYGDDDEEKKKKLRQGVWSQFVELVPFVGKALAELLQGKPIMDGVSLLPALEPVGKTVRHVTEKEYEDAVVDAIEALGYALKLPVSGPKRVLRAIESGNPGEVLGWR